MGTSSSKSDDEGFQERRGSIPGPPKNRRSSLSKYDQIENISKIVDNMKNEIDIFDGNRTSSRYKEFQKIFTTLATELQQIRNKSKKQEYRDRCNEVQGQIQICLQRLETRVNFNEQIESSLDLGSVKSHSFINHTFNQRPPPPDLLNQKWTEAIPPPTKQRQLKFDSIKSLENIEQETQNLEKDVKHSIEIENSKQFDICENKIKILYTDLELIRVDEHTPLGNKKAAIGKRLIRCNNQIKRFKKNLEKKANPQASTQDGAALSNVAGQKKEENQLDDFAKTKHLLEDLEIQALTFEGVKGDKKYKELEQVLESHWTKVYSMDAFGDEERRRKSLIIERTKNILQELRKRAEENEKQLKAIKSIHKIEQQLQGAKKETETFEGVTKDSSYLKLDQELRDLWAKLSEVEEPNEHVRRSKARVISDIQYVLKNLAQETKNRESKIYENADVIKKAKVTTKSSLTAHAPMDEEILQKQLLKQVERFQNHWNQLNYNLDVQKISTLDVSKAIIDIFEKILDGVSKKTNALSIIEKRKSYSSLVAMLEMEKSNEHVLTNFAQDIGNRESNIYENIAVIKNIKGITKSSLSADDSMDEESLQKQLLKQVEGFQNHWNQLNYNLDVQKMSKSETSKTIINIFEKLLEEVSNRSLSIIQNRRSKTTNEAFKVLEKKISPTSTLEQDKAATKSRSKAQELMDIDAGIQYFRQQIKNFTGVTKDEQYEKIKRGLADSLSKLLLIVDMDISNKESIREIQQYNQELETKVAENQAKVKVSEQKAEMRRQISQDIKGIVEQVQNLRSQVDRFSGVYEGLLYKKIEENLKSCSEKLEDINTLGDDKLQSARLQTKQKIQKYLRILQDKSMKSSSPEQTTQDQAKLVQKSYSVHGLKEKEEHSQVNSTTEPDVVRYQKIQKQSQIVDPDLPHYKINALRDKLVEIKKKTETFSGKFKDGEYSDIENQLVACFNELKGINDRGHKSVIISKEQYADYIEKLLEYFEEKTKVSEAEKPEVQKAKGEEVKTVSNQIQAKQSIQKSNHRTVDPTQELTAIEEKITEIKSQIKIIQGTAADAYVCERKEKLLQELQNCAILVEETVQHRQEMVDYPMEHDVKGGKARVISDTHKFNQQPAAPALLNQKSIKEVPPPPATKHSTKTVENVKQQIQANIHPPIVKEITGSDLEKEFVFSEEAEIERKINPPVVKHASTHNKSQHSFTTSDEENCIISSLTTQSYEEEKELQRNNIKKIQTVAVTKIHPPIVQSQKNQKISLNSEDNCGEPSSEENYDSYEEEETFPRA